MPCSASASRSWPEYETWARSPSTQIRLPSVVALRKYQRAAQRVAFTRFNVFLRDRFTCQYCGETFASSALTFEHVIPRSRGGQTTWSNIVTACVPCNTGKGNSLRIKPRRLPKEPTLNELLVAKRAFPLPRPAAAECDTQRRFSSPNSRETAVGCSKSRAGTATSA